MQPICLVTSLMGVGTIKLRCKLQTANKFIKMPELYFVLDTGAERTSVARHILAEHGYGKYTKASKPMHTAVGPVDMHLCQIRGLTIANQFTYGVMQVGILENWKGHSVGGVIGMDILRQLTLILSHEYKKFLLTDNFVPELAKLLC